MPCTITDAASSRFLSQGQEQFNSESTIGAEGIPVGFIHNRMGMGMKRAAAGVLTERDLSAQLLTQLVSACRVHAFKMKVQGALFNIYDVERGCPFGTAPTILYVKELG